MPILRQKAGAGVWRAAHPKSALRLLLALLLLAAARDAQQPLAQDRVGIAFFRRV